MELNHRFLFVRQESLPLDHGTVMYVRLSGLTKKPSVRLESLTYLAAGVGIEPTSQRSERRVLPLDDPATVRFSGRSES